MKIAGFTGSQYFHPPTHGQATDAILFRLHDFNAFVTGGCAGLDSYAARRLYEFFPPERGYAHIILIPDDFRTVGKVDWDLEDDLPLARFIRLPKGTMNKDLNQLIVNYSTELFAAPRGPEASLRRSGTWQTIRMARTKGIPIHEYYLPDLAVATPL